MSKLPSSHEVSDWILSKIFTMASVIVHAVVYISYFAVLHGSVVNFINYISIEAVFIGLLTGISTMKTRSQLKYHSTIIAKLLHHGAPDKK